MEIKVIDGGVATQNVDAVIVSVCEGLSEPTGSAALVDAALGGLITRLIAGGEIRGKKNELTVIHTPDHAYRDFSPERVLVAGIGQSNKFHLDDLRSLTALIARRLRSIGVKTAATAMHGADVGGLDSGLSAEAISEGAILGLYEFNRYRTVSNDDGFRRRINCLSIIELDKLNVDQMEVGAERGKIFAEAAVVARDMVNEPPNIVTPTRMSKIAENLAKEHSSLTLKVMDEVELAGLGMGAFLGVAKGSHEPPKLIELTYNGAPEMPEKNIWLVGKGITFDSGGLSLKPSSGMETMKGDMAGGATVLAAISAIAKLCPNINVTALVPATENMPGGGAQRVGDIVRSMNGKTIEVINTDAEGRLVIADALTYAIEQGASRLIDIATLTGGVIVALGRGNSAAFSNNDELVNTLMEAGRRRGEGIWRLPLDEMAKKQNESKLADLKNSGGREAQPITGAAFIGEFAGDTPWVHMDIAGTSMVGTTDGWTVAGSTGVPTRSLIQVVLDLAQ